MKPVLKVSVKHPFGREVIRPDNDIARLFAQLLNQDSFTRIDVENIKALGYRIEVQAPTVEEL